MFKLWDLSNGKTDVLADFIKQVNDSYRTKQKPDYKNTTITPRRTKGVRRLTGDITATTNVLRDNLLAVMPHKVIQKILGEPTYLAMRTWFKKICTNLIAVKTPQDWRRGKSHLGMLQSPAAFHAKNGDFDKPPPNAPPAYPNILPGEIGLSANTSELNTRYFMSTGPSTSTQGASQSTSEPPCSTNGWSLHSKTLTRV